MGKRLMRGERVWRRTLMETYVNIARDLSDSLIHSDKETN